MGHRKAELREEPGTGSTWDAPVSQLPKTPCRNQFLPDEPLLPAGACGAVPAVEPQGCCTVGMQLAGIATGKMKHLELFVLQFPHASHHAQGKLP